MSIKISGYEFSGPQAATAALEDRSGVYAILARNATDYALLDVGESVALKIRVEDHDRKPCWARRTNGRAIGYAIYYTPGAQQAGRQAIEQRIRRDHIPPCGNR